MSDAGGALLGIGMGAGDKRAIEAATAAVSSPLLETTLEGAKSILLSITGGRDLSLWEVNEAARAVQEAAHPDANIIFGAMLDEKLEDEVWITVVATGYGEKRAPREDQSPFREPIGEPRVHRAGAPHAGRVALRPARWTCRSSSRGTSPGSGPGAARGPSATGVVAAGHPLTAEAGADVLRAGGNAVDAALAAMLTSFVAEPLLTGLGAGGYMLVAAPEREPVLLDFFVAAPGRGADPRRGRRWCRSTSRSATPCRCSTSARHPAASTARRPGSAPRPRASARSRSPSSRRRPRRSPARAWRSTPSRRTCSRSSCRSSRSTAEARALLHARGAGAAGRRRAARPALADALERLGAEGAAPFYEGDIAAAIFDRVCERGGTLTREDLAAYRAEPREPVRVRYRGREVLTNPPPTAGGMLLAYALALLEREPGRPDAARARAGDGARPGRAHAGVPHGPRRAGLPGALHGEPAGLDDAHLGARRRRLGVLGHVHERRGLGHRRARHRRARQQHDGRAGPLAARLLHAPAGPAAAVDDGPDGRARRPTARPSWCSARRARTGSARRSCR